MLKISVNNVNTIQYTNPQRITYATTYGENRGF